MSTNQIGDRIKAAREAKGISASEFARRVSVTPTCVWNWERGNTHPRSNAVKAIAEALQVDEASLLTGARFDNPAVKCASPAEIDDILDKASMGIAAALGMAKDRIKLKFEVSQD